MKYTEEEIKKMNITFNPEVFRRLLDDGFIGKV